MSFLRPCGSKRQSRADGLRLEALLEEVAVATVLELCSSLLTLDRAHASMALCSLNRSLAVVVVDVAAGYTLDGFSHGLFALSDEQVEVV